MDKKKRIISFLKLNGFEKMEANSYANNLCNVTLHDDCLTFADNQGNTTLFGEMNIYTLIGWLTYYSYIPKDFKIKSTPINLS